ncbi:hypothetical protein [Prevotella denticola]|uniref:hypothetical protein n=1 Tax=Prevotella denticola TaxID=28129 RepID=UPI00138AC81D|nr:hypothetical protein [Prevotella denticola]MBW4715251.1 hypothetical protein [Prevotella denticola]MBW4752995.1 hypothetical protein [Prevotella denticola]
MSQNHQAENRNGREATESRHCEADLSEHTGFQHATSYTGNKAQPQCRQTLIGTAINASPAPDQTLSSLR